MFGGFRERAQTDLRAAARRRGPRSSWSPRRSRTRCARRPTSWSGWRPSAMPLAGLVLNRVPLQRRAELSRRAAPRSAADALDEAGDARADRGGAAGARRPGPAGGPRPTDAGPASPAPTRTCRSPRCRRCHATCTTWTGCAGSAPRWPADHTGRGTAAAAGLHPLCRPAAAGSSGQPAACSCRCSRRAVSSSSARTPRPAGASAAPAAHARSCRPRRRTRRGCPARRPGTRSGPGSPCRSPWRGSAPRPARTARPGPRSGTAHPSTSPSATQRSSARPLAYPRPPPERFAHSRKPDSVPRQTPIGSLPVTRSD